MKPTPTQTGGRPKKASSQLFFNGRAYDRTAFRTYGPAPSSKVRAILKEQEEFMPMKYRRGVYRF